MFIVLYDFFFFFQAEDGIRDAQESRGLGDVYKRQFVTMASAKAPILGKTTKADLPADLFTEDFHQSLVHETARADANSRRRGTASSLTLSLIHI